MRATSHLDPAEPSSTGLAPRVAGALAAFGWWLTGLAFLFLERRSLFVRYQAAQAVIILGSLWLLGVALVAGSFLSLVFGGNAFQPLLAVSKGVWIVAVVCWIGCVVSAAMGYTWRVPLVGRLVESLATRRGGE